MAPEFLTLLLVTRASTHCKGVYRGAADEAERAVVAIFFQNPINVKFSELESALIARLFLNPGDFGVLSVLRDLLSDRVHWERSDFLDSDQRC